MASISRNDSLQEQIKKTQNKLATQEEYFSSLKESKEKLKGYQSEVSKINSVLPTEASLPSLYRFFQNKTSQTGLILKNIGSFNFSKPKISSTAEEKEATTSASSKISANLQKVTFELEATGSYEDFKSFLSVLENSSRMFEVEKISFFFSGERRK